MRPKTQELYTPKEKTNKSPKLVAWWMDEKITPKMINFVIKQTLKKQNVKKKY